MTSNVFEKMEMPATVGDVLREVSNIRATVTEAVDDGVKSAMRTMKQGRAAAEDMRDAAKDAIDDARRTVKQKPIQAMGVVFAIGVLAGCVLTMLGRRR